MAMDLGRCLITGANGFVGRHLGAMLTGRGVKVRALLRHETNGPWQEVVKADLTAGDLPAMLMEGVQTVFHLAGIAHDATADAGAPFRQVNVEGTRKLLERAADSGVLRFIYISSVKAMGEPGNECVGEEWRGANIGEYGASKREAEHLVLEAGRAGGRHVCILRPVLVYGAGVKGNLATMLDAMRNGGFPPVPEVGNRRSLVHVDDLVRALVCAAENPAAAGKTYIVTDGVNYSTRRIYEILMEALGKPVPKWSVPYKLMHFGAACGDFVERIAGLPMTLNSDRLTKLFGSACYRSDRIRCELGWASNQTLMLAAPEMVRSLDMRIGECR